jgi:hypothetical protein
MNQATQSPFLPVLELDGDQMHLLDLLCEELTYEEIAVRQQRTRIAVGHEFNRLAHKLNLRTALGLAVWWTRSRSALYVPPPILKKVASAAL